MKTKMIEVKNKESAICISCCDKTKSVREISINRTGGSYAGSNIVTFSLCNDCLKRLAMELRPFS